MKAVRIRLGMSQSELAAKMNTSQQRISEWELGKVEPSLYALTRLLKVLDVSFDELTEGM